MKKIVSVVLVLCMLFSVLALPAQAEESMEPAAVSVAEQMLVLRYVACPVGPGACVWREEYRKNHYDNSSRLTSTDITNICTKCGTQRHETIWY